MTPSSSTDRKDNSGYSWQGLLRSFDRKSIRELLVIPGIISLAIALAAVFTTEKPVEVMSSIAGVIFSVLPSLSGLVLAGYAIFVGTVNPEKYEPIFRKRENGKSLFQTLNDNFAQILLIVLLTILISFIISTMIKLEVTTTPELASIANFFATFILSLSLLISLRSLSWIIINLWNFGKVVSNTSSVENNKD